MYMYVTYIYIYYIHTHIYIYIYMLALPPPRIYAFVVLGAWGARNTVMLKKFQNFQP